MTTVRIVDVAAKAGVSETTASHVLRGYRGSKIKQETWDHVLRVANELGYRPNAIARSLKIKRTNAIGLFTGYTYYGLRDPFLAEVFTGMLKACGDLHYDFLVHGDIAESSASEIRLKLNDGRICGLVVHGEPGNPVIAELSRSHLPAVAIADRHPQLPSVVADDVDGMRLIVDYLWERGHRTVAYLTSPHKLASIEARSETIVRLFDERGGKCRVIPFPDDPDSGIPAILTGPNRPTALCCWNDYFAYYAIRICDSLGIKMPDDVAIVGFDGLIDHLLPARNLVTVAVPWQDVAAEAVRIIVRQLDGVQPPPITTFPVTLVAGDTA
jgi:DNA-binding LacI/PurR family transcriptional regulator